MLDRRKVSTRKTFRIITWRAGALVFLRQMKSLMFGVIFLSMGIMLMMGIPMRTVIKC